jgi:DNA polymerase-3 subunit epsilon
MALMHNRFLALDFETANNGRNSACALGIAVVEDRIITEHVSFLIKPPKNYFIHTDIHGITWNDVKSKPTFEDIWPDIKKYFNKIDFIAAHNVPFDRSVMEACCDHYSIKAPKEKYRCTLKLSREKLNLESNTLDSVCRYYGIELDHHNALSDTMACAKIMINLFGNK